MDFRSDNVASAAPEIVEAVVEAGRGSATPYGGDPWTEGLESAFSELFETKVKVFPVVTGTAANSVAVATLTPPWGVIYAGRAAHVENDECGAPEFMTGGAKVAGIEERFGKIQPQALEAALDAAGTGEVHWSQPACLSLTQPTEMGPDLHAGRACGTDRHRAPPRPRGAHGRCPLCQCCGRQRGEPGGRSPGGSASTRSPSARPRTARWRLRRSCSSPMPARASSPSATSGRGSSSPRCASSRPSSRLTSRTASGSGWRSRPTAKRSGLPPVWRLCPVPRSRRPSRPTSSSSPCRGR